MARTRKKDKNPADILHLLRSKQLSYADVDRKFALTRGSALHASRKPHEPGEVALSEVLEIPAHRIWPSRYDPQTGKRLKPQPKANSKPKRALRHREKATAVASCGQSDSGAAA